MDQYSGPGVPKFFGLLLDTCGVGGSSQPKCWMPPCYAASATYVCLFCPLTTLISHLTSRTRKDTVFWGISNNTGVQITKTKISYTEAKEDDSHHYITTYYIAVIHPLFWSEVGRFFSQLAHSLISLCGCVVLIFKAHLLTSAELLQLCPDVTERALPLEQGTSYAESNRYLLHWVIMFTQCYR